MNGKARVVAYLVLTVALVLGTFALLAGCRKEKPATGTQGMAPMNHEAMSMPVKEEAASASAQTAEQTNCPVMGGPINKNIFVEYQGKKVYFCCGGCPDTFQANPEKYLSKLPQFAK